eukprot:Blabericola_migrator_1__4157@NODE_2270_length_3031_cov_70_633603_g86_i1_p1_GENE_NODE_2270_length_3031_cov_70_633603_g86_i1NODE_2270_length_3031_cov_70_633603_g86_i1_p1_ORF_typecomplete_len408_score124_44HOOK/PF05622_12/31HOOK/PF05622_12/0_00084HOOK/PF05622_12/4_1e06TACC_C/PF05010_14/1_3e03TACC_C/PF05010_14/18TACC_C/PF05010_14/4_1e05TACC_C/PF05010_14/0_21ATG16/PF08614_11/0_59ATG16/PF08614_11/0_025ATG16/PF08614_11/0_0011Myosin_tail_1/PF01576_19/1_6e03Myosin_tail_1/PF01576_19/0_0014Myosin_tail_1/PF
MIELLKGPANARVTELQNLLESDQIYIESLMQDKGKGESLKESGNPLEETWSSRRLQHAASHDEFVRLQVCDGCVMKIDSVSLISLHQMDLAEKTAAYDDLMAEFGLLEQQQADRERQIKMLKVLVEECKNEILDLRQDRDQALAELAVDMGSRDRYSQLERQLAVEHERLRSLQDELEDRQRETDDLKKALSDKTHELNRVSLIVKGLETATHDAAQKIVLLTAQAAELQAERDRLQRSAGHMTDDLAELQHRYDKLQQRLERLGQVGPDPFEILERQVLDLKGERGDLKARLSAVIVKLKQTEQSLNQSLQDHSQTKQSLEGIIQTLSSRLGVLEAQRDSLSKEYSELRQAHMTSLDSLRKLKRENKDLEDELRRTGDKSLALKLRNAEDEIGRWVCGIRGSVSM